MATRATTPQNKNRYLESLGQALRASRERAGLSQEEFAIRAGLGRAYVGSIERGGRNPTLGNLMALIEAAGEAPSVVLSSVLLEHQSAGPDELTNVQPPKRRRAAPPMAQESYSEMLGRAVLLERKKSGLSQEELAADTGMSRAHMGQLESGRTNPSFLTTMRILEVLQVAPSIFFRHFTLHHTGDAPTSARRREHKGMRQASARAHKKPSGAQG